MGTDEITCPICSADLPLAGDERKGDEVFCTFCGAPCRLTSSPESPDCSAEEDF